MQLKQPLIITIDLGILSIISWELYWRSQGHLPSIDDNKNLWAKEAENNLFTFNFKK